MASFITENPKTRKSEKNFERIIKLLHAQHFVNILERFDYFFYPLVNHSVSYHQK